MTDDVRDFLDESSGSRYPAHKFETMGQGIKGIVVEKPRVVETPALNPPHALEKKLVVALAMAPGADPVSVWVKRGFMASAVSDAIAASGATGLEVGGELAVAWVDTQPATKPGHNPAKIYRAQYKPPTSSAAVAVDDSMFDN